MPLIRGHHSFDDHFTQIPNSWLRDSRLTFKARGLLGLVMSHSTGWSLSVNSIAEQNQEGRDAIRSAIAELEEFGYLSREQVNELGRYGESVWMTHDPADKPTTENPTTENPTTKNNKLKEEQSFKNSKRTTAQLLFDEFWKEYPRKLDKAKATRAFASALTRASLEDILAGVIRYRNDPNRLDEFTKYPASWLNADSWENGPLPEDSRAKKRREQQQQEKIMKEWGNESE